MELGITERTPPTNIVDITTFTTEALLMLHIFCPNIWNHPEGALVSAVEDELKRRGIVKDLGDRLIEWDLDDDTRVELVDIWTVDRMLQMFRLMTKASRKRK